MKSAARDGCNAEDAATPPVAAATDIATARRRNLALSIVSACVSPFAAFTGSLHLRCSLPRRETKARPNGRSSL